MTHTNGDNAAHFWTVSLRRFFSILQLFLHLKSDRGYSNSDGNPVYFLTSLNLVSCCDKWACLSDCVFRKVAKIVGHSPPNPDVGKVWGKGFLTI